MTGGLQEQTTLRGDVVPIATVDARTLYDDVNCARGGMENRIKEQEVGGSNPLVPTGPQLLD